MAYIKSKQLNNGFSAEYWRVTSVPANKLSQNTEVVVHGYKDKSTREAGDRPVTSLIYVIPTSFFNLSDDLFAQAYECIKDKKDSRSIFKKNEEPFFADAISD